jgi:hypothetical protein
MGKTMRSNVGGLALVRRAKHLEEFRATKTNLAAPVILVVQYDASSIVCNANQYDVYVTEAL